MGIHYRALVDTAQDGEVVDGKHVKYPVASLLKFAFSSPEHRLTWLFVCCCVGTSFLSILNLAPPMAIGWLIDSLAGEPPSFLNDGGTASQHASTLIVLFVVLSVVSGALDYAISFGFLVFAQKVLARLRSATFERLMFRPIDFYESNRTGNLLSVVSGDVNTLAQFISQTFANSLKILIGVISATVAIGRYNLRLFGFTCIPVPVILLSSYFFNSILKRKFKFVRQRIGAINSSLETCISGVREIKSFCKEENESLKISTESTLLCKTTISASATGYLIQPAIRVFGSLALALALYVGTGEVLDGSLRVGELAAIIMLVRQMIQPLARIGAVVSNWASASAAIERVFGILLSSPGITSPSPCSIVKPGLLTVEYSNVTFSYNHNSNDNQPNVLKNLSFTVGAGASLGIAGQTGSGKTTILKLLLRFYDPQDGAVLVGGTDLRQLDLKSLRSAVALVSQETYLFSGSIRENIAYALSGTAAMVVDSDEVHEQVVSAAKIAHLHDFICTLPAGYDTVLGDRGAQLSGGQRQRMAIARAIVKNAPILAFDEATSALDSQTERAIQASLGIFLPHHTCLIIAHRLGTLRTCDDIIVLSDGHVSEQGTHEQLSVQENTLYSQMLAIETGDYLLKNYIK